MSQSRKEHVFETPKDISKKKEVDSRQQFQKEKKKKWQNIKNIVRERAEQRVSVHRAVQTNDNQLSQDSKKEMKKEIYREKEGRREGEQKNKKRERERERTEKKKKGKETETM